MDSHAGDTASCSKRRRTEDADPQPQTQPQAQPQQLSDRANYPRKRVSVACELCRVRKTRCDAGRPSCSFCASAGVAATHPIPSPVIPFGRDADFVERGTILDQIQHKCAVPSSRTALVGLGGIGKSQLAIEYTYRTRERSPETLVFWVHASNRARFEQSYRDIANYAKISWRQNPRANIFQLVHDWLRDERKGKWVLILDNVDDTGFLLEAHGTGDGVGRMGSDRTDSRPLVSYLPQCQNGSILITTRSASEALKLVEQRDIIVVEPMNEADALALSEKKLGKHDDRDSVTELATALEFMPLAIVQATAYISYRAPRCSVQQYLQEFQKCDRKRANLLNCEGGELRRDCEAKNPVNTTWQISFDYIRQIRPYAAELLSLMSFCDRQGIPKALLQNRSEHKGDRQDQKENDGHECLSSSAYYDTGEGNGDEEEEEDDISQSSVSDEFEDSILALRDYSFISINKDGVTFEMHGLVQLATQKWLEAHGQQERWKRRFIRNLDAVFPTGGPDNWSTCQVLFPHANLTVAQKSEEQESWKSWASILYKAAWHAWSMGNWIEAEKMVRATRVGKKLGPDHPDTLTSMANLASAYWNQGQWDAAEKLEIEVMDTSKKRLGEDHPNTLTSMNNLAFTLKGQGRDAEAIDLMKDCVRFRKHILGDHHPYFISSSTTLAQWESETGGSARDVAERNGN